MLVKMVGPCNMAGFNQVRIPSPFRAKTLPGTSGYAFVGILPNPHNSRYLQGAVP